MLDVTMGAQQIFEEVQHVVQSVAITEDLEEEVDVNDYQVDGPVYQESNFEDA